ncbi:N-acetylglucosamine kinase [Virgibacillus necropolis]|uniref:ATPase BadF/BadG/BcrA/BcrD type domain-containing protein n=1 Tax=Virgibacillus necropolis TaxID=163877 RepID=A0A221MAP3_9BACI|nr:BadF/BadG/BcrA/BcrD ATPase family protein [Virgibacillus necropolis]ASN04670.1 hypothetical protein CFK40_06390 [Virgibacillus necropolis]
MEYVIGIDGGGTKTEALMADENGTIVASTFGGPTNPNVLTTEELYQTLEALVHDLNQQVPGQFTNVAHLFAGISGAGEKKNQEKIKRIFTRLLPTTTLIEVYPDSINALYSGTFGEPGIVQISGTGSITYGINNQLIHDRVGGWGYLFGDEGSGYDIGKQGIVAALKAFDGRGKDTILLEMLYDLFQVKDGHELIRDLYASSMPKEKIAPISQVVFKAYELHDAVAQDIVANVVDELKSSIVTLHKKLFDNKENVQLVLCGGVFSDKTILPPLIEKELKRYNTEFSIVIPEFPPVGGSLIGAYLSMNTCIDNKMITMIKDGYKKINKKSR